MAWDTSDRRARLPRNWPTLRRAILKRDRGVCQLRHPGCLIRATEVDHIVAGDNHAPGNLRALCSSCHKGVTAVQAKTAQAAVRTRGKRDAEPHPGLTD